MKRKWLAIGIILLFLGICIIPSTGQNVENFQTTSRGKWLYVGGSGPGNYTRIQDAINASSNGNSIFVYNGTFYENVEINKVITLLGQNKHGTIIDAGGVGDVVHITAEYACIKGFTLRGGGGEECAGVKVDAKNITICNNIIVNNSDFGILQEPSANKLYTVISSNIIQGNSRDGISLWRDNNLIYNNTISENYFGIVIWIGQYNMIKSNTIKNNNYGINIMHDSNTILSNTIQDNDHYGIYVSYCDSNTIENNIIKNNGDYGINLENYQDAELFLPASNNNIIGNSISGHSIGVLVESDCDNNVIRGNNIAGNTRGLYVDVSNNTVIEQNNFIGNSKNVYYRTYWKYDIVFTQNYWDDWHGASKKIILGKTALFHYWFFIPCFRFDNAPAQEPYEIPGMS